MESQSFGFSEVLLNCHFSRFSPPLLTFCAFTFFSASVRHSPRFAVYLPSSIPWLPTHVSALLFAAPCLRARNHFPAPTTRKSLFLRSPPRGQPNPSVVSPPIVPLPMLPPSILRPPVLHLVLGHRTSSFPSTSHPPLPVVYASYFDNLTWLSTSPPCNSCLPLCILSSIPPPSHGITAPNFSKRFSERAGSVKCTAVPNGVQKSCMPIK